MDVAYDSLLNLNMPDETCLVCYADYVTALISAISVELAQLNFGFDHVDSQRLDVRSRPVAYTQQDRDCGPNF